MNTRQLQEAVYLAKESNNYELSGIDTTILHGCALFNFKHVSTTIKIVAAMIRYQCIQLNGEFDSLELNSLTDVFRRKVTII